MSLLVPDILAGPFFAAAGLLAVGGLTKVWRPEAASRALSAAGLPSNALFVRFVAGWEILVGASCLVAPLPPAALALAGTYACFAVFLAYLMATKVSIASCGCVGQREIPPSVLHIFFNLVAVSAGVLVAFTDLPGVVPFASGLPLWGFPVLVGIPLAGYLAYLTVAFLPELLRAAGSGRSRTPTAEAKTFSAVSIGRGE